MNIAKMIVAVGLVTEFLKKAARAMFKIDVSGKAAVVLSVIVSAGVVVVEAVTTDVPLTLALIPVLIQVAIGANAGFALLKVRGK